MLGEQTLQFSQKLNEADTIMNPTLQIKEQRQVELLSHGHQVSTWQR